jgi:serine protease
MPRRSKLVRVLMLATFLAATALWWSRSIKAQSPSWTPPYPMILTPERALAFAQAADRKLDYVPGEVLVKFKPGVTPAGQQRSLMALRSRPAVSQLDWIADDTAVLRDTLEWDASILASQLSGEPEVEYAEPNYLYHVTSSPNDPGFSARQWNFAALDMPRAWDINPGATSSIIVAVVDSGITDLTTQDLTFPTWNGRAIQNVGVPIGANPDLARGRLINPRDFAFWGGPVLDMVGHGTHVSSTIGEDTNNALAEAGIAYNVRIMPVKVCVGYWELQFMRSASGIPGFNPRSNDGGCSTAQIAQGIRYAADTGAKVINISLGGPQPSGTVQDALNYAVGKGAFVAISAGNGFIDDRNAVEYPAGYAPGIDGVMAVAAVGLSLKRASYSTTGPQVEIAAPGGDFPDGGPAGQIWQATISQTDSDSRTIIFPRFDRYLETPFEGRSMASPHIAGIAALIMSQGVTNPAAVEAIIKATARDLGAPGRDNEYGYGLIQPRAALRGVGVK